MKALALTAIVAGCANLPAFEPGTCGNLVIDPGEDCDDTTALCDRCALRCDDTKCPAGYACGVDRFCHAPSGVFSIDVSASLAFAGKAFAITDIDRDGYGDLVALSQTSLSVSYGEANGSLQRQASTLTPVFKGPASFANLDGDRSLDVLLPTADGIAAYTSPLGVLSPYPFGATLKVPPTCRNQVGKPFKVVSVDDQNLALFTRLFDDPSTPADETNRLGIAIFNPTQKVVCPSQVQLICNIDATVPLFNQIDVYDTTRAGIPSRVAALNTGGPQGGFCAVNIVKNGASFTITVTSPPATPAFGARPTLVDLTSAGGCPSVIDSSAGPAGLREFRGSGTPGACTLAAVATPLALGASIASQLPATTVAIGHVELVPPVANMGKDALALTSGVYAIATDRLSARELYHSDRVLHEIRSADIDRDGNIDAVAIEPGSDAVDVLVRAAGAAFLLLRIDTIAPVGDFALADFDGNGIADIAYVENRSGSQRLMLAFGTPDRPLPAIEAGTFEFIVGLIPEQIKDSNDPFAIVSDLAVMDLVPGLPYPRLTVLHGSPQRSMLSFFDPRPPSASSTFVGVASGNFIASAGSAVTDVVAIELPAQAPANLWPLVGLGGGALDFSTATPTEIDNCTSAGAAFCADSGHYLTWSLSDRDVVIGVDDGMPRHTIVIDPATWVPSYQVGAANPLSDVPTDLSLRSMYAIDMRGDGSRALVAAFGARIVPDDGTHGVVKLCDVDATGTPTVCQDLTALVPELAGWACLDATPAHVSSHTRRSPPSAATDLLVLCHTGTSGASDSQIFRVSHDTIGYRAVAMLGGAKAYDRIAVGDVTGDGVDDLFVVELGSQTTSSSLRVIAQCASHDLACQRLRLGL